MYALDFLGKYSGNFMNSSKSYKSSMAQKIYIFNEIVMKLY